jgi:hypothetical protein
MAIYLYTSIYLYMDIYLYKFKNTIFTCITPTMKVSAVATPIRHINSSLDIFVDSVALLIPAKKNQIANMFIDIIIHGMCDETISPVVT